MGANYQYRVFAMIENFECIKCGHCCRTLPTLNGFPCPYLKDNLCSVHENKTVDCLDYPLTLEIAIRTGCKGITQEQAITSTEGQKEI